MALLPYHRDILFPRLEEMVRELREEGVGRRVRGRDYFVLSNGLRGSLSILKFTYYD